MSYSQTVFANQQIYYIFNRGVDKRTIYLDKRDYRRFIESINYYRIKNPPARFSFKKRQTSAKKITANIPLVEILSFCLMPKRFHILARQIEDKGITNFISRLCNSYARYFNTRYKRAGPLFQGSFKAIRVEDDEQLLHLSRHIHLNPLTGYLVKNLRAYQFSSYPEYLNLAAGFCQKEAVLDYFESSKHYETFVLNQADYAKSLKEKEEIFIDIRDTIRKVSP